MRKALQSIKAITAAATVVSTIATATLASGAIIKPGTTLPDGTVVISGGAGGPNLGPDEPGSKPRAPGQPGLVLRAGVVNRTATSLALQWRDNSSYEQGFRLYRGPGFTGPWTLIAAFGAVSGNSAVLEYTDTGLNRDTRYYYRVGAYNIYGETLSVPQTFGTLDGRVQVARLQFSVRTANIADADTEDDVHVAVNDTNVNYGTYLDYGRDDFERGDHFTYELVPDGVTDLSDINQLMIFKTGTDGWCIDRIALLVNGGEVYNETFSPCRWLDDSGSSPNAHVVERATLRAHPLWQQLVIPFKASIEKRELGDIVEGMVGNLIHEDIALPSPVYIGNANPYWGRLNGDRAVAVTGKDAQTVHIAFNLGIGIIGEDLDVDFSFDARLTGVCRTPTTPPAIHMTIENIDARPHFGTFTQILTASLINLAKDWVATTIETQLQALLPNLARDFSIPFDQIQCVTPQVDAEGNVNFIVQNVPKIQQLPPIGVITGGVQLR